MEQLKNDEFHAFQQFISAKMFLYDALTSSQKLSFSMELFLAEICKREDYKVPHEKNISPSLDDMIKFLCTEIDPKIPKHIWQRFDKKESKHFNVFEEIRRTGNRTKHAGVIVPSIIQMAHRCHFFESKFIDWYVTTYKIDDWEEKYKSHFMLHSSNNSNGGFFEGITSKIDVQLNEVKESLKAFEAHFKETKSGSATEADVLSTISSSIKNLGKQIEQLKGENTEKPDIAYAPIDEATKKELTEESNKKGELIKELEIKFTSISNEFDGFKKIIEEEKRIRREKIRKQRIQILLAAAVLIIAFFSFWKITGSSDTKKTVAPVDMVTKDTTSQPPVSEIGCGNTKPEYEYIRTELLKIINTDFSKEERIHLANITLEKYFDQEFYVTFSDNPKDKNPDGYGVEIGKGDEGRLYLTEHLIAFPSILDIIIIEAQLNNSTGKISGLKVCEVYNNGNN